MFEILVVGPIFAERLGVVRQCIECRRNAGLDASPCQGFGPGCLIPPSNTVPTNVSAAWRRPA